MQWACTLLMLVVTSLFLCLATLAAQFEEVTQAAGLTNLSGYCMGVAWGDYDNDGRIDLYLASGGPSAHVNDLYRNTGDGTFARVGAEAGPITTDSHSSFGCAWIDFNNDGFRDLFVLNGGWTAAGNDFYWNHGDGTFGRGIVGDLGRERIHSWFACADFDGDGWLDVYSTEADDAAGPFEGLLYRGKPDETFAPMSIGVSEAYLNDGVWGDYDNDGDPDLYLSNFTSPCRLLRNDGGGRFTPLDTGLPSDFGVTHAAWTDYDNDGDLDIALGTFSRVAVYRNDGAAGFVRVAVLAGNLTLPAWADYDNDGRPDLLAVGGQGITAVARLFHNDGGDTFTPVEEPFTEVADYRLGCAWGDYDNDGFPDLAIAQEQGHNGLFHNLTNANHWIKFKLVGTASNRDAVGTKVRLQATIGGQTVWQMQEVNGGYQIQNDTRLNFGLGDATNIDLVRIEWPSGNVQERTNVVPDQILAITEVAGITPARPSASLNGSVTLTRPLFAGATYQWQFDGVDLTGQTNRTLNLTNILANQQGRYSVVVSNATMLTTNYVYLLVDTNFTKITTGPPVTDLGPAAYGSWGDYDGDGDPDLFVARHDGGRSGLYRNNGDGTFTSITNLENAPFATVDAWITGAWADLDNDGLLDLVTARENKPAIVYYNSGDGTFSPLGLAPAQPGNVAVIDYNQDGRLDLLLYGSWTLSPAGSWLYRNNGDRTFTRMTSQEVGPILNFAGVGAATCADYDDDGWVDVFCSNWAGDSKLFQNDGTGRFVLATNVVFNQRTVIAGAWSDYDNDGRVDLCAASWGGTSFVYRNLGNGEFERAAIGQTLQGSYFSASWADYDNDGFLDLLLTSVESAKNALYHNNGDGTFTRITSGSIVTDKPVGGAGSWAGLWFDYDNDGFLDLYVFNDDGNGTATAANFLYHNNGNTNAWLTVRLVGTASNRDAVGAKVRVQARYAGQVRWQRRDITGGDVLNGNQLDAHFGLGNATNVATLRIEWPSGMVQTLTNVAPRQILTVWEPPVMSAAVRADGACELTIKAEPNRGWQIKASSDLLTWQTLTTVTNTAGAFQFTDTAAAGMDCRFYRVEGE